MLLSYETSSLSYDDADVVHGKFIPARHHHLRLDCGDMSCDKYRSTATPVRIFINVYGVFADLSGAFAHKYDEFELPRTQEFFIDYEYIRKNIPKSGVAAIMEEDGFWKNMQSYSWYMLVMGEIYRLCAGDYYLLLPLYDSLQLEDRLTWIWRHFGNSARDRTMLLACPSAQLLIRGRNDLFIGSNLKNCQDWNLAGGSSFWWPEIDGKCKEPSEILSKRIKLLSQAVAGLRDLSKK